MLLQRLHFLRRLIPNQGIYKLKERAESPSSLFLFNLERGSFCSVTKIYINLIIL